VYGLMIEFVGVLLIFKWGPPQPLLEVQDLVVVSMSAEEEAKARRKRLTYKVMSFVALTLIAAGLFLQLIDAWK
jgi:hypothetical protein